MLRRGSESSLLGKYCSVVQEAYTGSGALFSFGQGLTLQRASGLPTLEILPELMTFPPAGINSGKTSSVGQGLSWARSWQRSRAHQPL